MNELVTAFLAEKKLVGIRPHTLADYQRNLKKLCQVVDPATANHLQLTAFFAELAERGLTQSTLRKYFKVFNTFFAWRERQGYGENPMTRVPKPRKAKTLPKFLSEDEVRRLLESERQRQGWWGFRSYNLIQLALATGLRRAELSALTVDDVSAECIVVREGKGGKDRVVPTDPTIIPDLELWLEVRGRRFQFDESIKWLFPNRSGGQLTNREIGEHVREAGKRIGIGLSPHMLRHTFATLYLSNGGSIAALQAILGHSKIETTAIYLHTSTKMIKADLLKASPLGNLKQPRFRPVNL